MAFSPQEPDTLTLFLNLLKLPPLRLSHYKTPSSRFSCLQPVVVMGWRGFFKLQITSHQVRDSLEKKIKTRKTTPNIPNPAPNSPKLHKDSCFSILTPGSIDWNHRLFCSRAANWNAFAFVGYKTWSKSRSAISAIHSVGCIFLKILSSTLVLNVVSDTRLIFMLCLQKSSFPVSALCLGEEGICVCAPAFMFCTELWDGADGEGTVQIDTPWLSQSKRETGCLDTELSI